jgi:hypothetical protein
MAQGEVKKRRLRVITPISSDDNDSFAQGNSHEDDDENSEKGVSGPYNRPLLILLSEFFLLSLLLLLSNSKHKTYNVFL